MTLPSLICHITHGAGRHHLEKSHAYLLSDRTWRSLIVGLASPQLRCNAVLRVKSACERAGYPDVTCASTRCRRASTCTPCARNVLTGLTAQCKHCTALPHPAGLQEIHMLALNYHGSRDVRVETVPDP
ncbi:hypothetical protein XdyCFBP7245_06940 [Xanthomonas dyei]|uniref:Uncharacterized protein n=1 Tax=Xanthomonas dyei TaxID=743699 RepID=A0A2S7C6U1_9XANT|nr:hypothetical protein XdyCFBP7245_06940 [Xanthomonas dyei]